MAKVGDWQPRSGTIVLRQHKTHHKTGKPRTIVLSPRASEIVQKRCQGRSPCDPLFIRRDGKAWTVSCVADRLNAIKERAGVRPNITAYGFRHLWCSDAILSGVDVATVAAMMGTSVAMIERTYGHLRSARLMEVHEQVKASRVARGVSR